MFLLKKYEEQVLEILTKDVLRQGLIESIKTEGTISSYETTGHGYFLTIIHKELPDNRIVCSQPLLIGESEGIQTGFVIFIQNHELTLECHGWSDVEIPRTYREQDVKITTA